MAKVKYELNIFEDLKYCPYSRTGLRYKSTNREAGTLETYKGQPKAARVEILGIRYLCHRVVWVLIHGSIDHDLDIDHKDGNPWNNKIENLRLVEKKINQRNRKRLSNNKTGVNGVFFHVTSNNSGGYNEYLRVVWVENGKQKKKDFNIKKFPSREHAIEFGELLRDMAIPDKETYSERHGK